MESHSLATPNICSVFTAQKRRQMNHLSTISWRETLETFYKYMELERGWLMNFGLRILCCFSNNISLNRTLNNSSPFANAFFYISCT